LREFQNIEIFVIFFLKKKKHDFEIRMHGYGFQPWILSKLIEKGWIQ